MTSSIFVIDLHYICELDQIDAARDAHIAFLDAHYASGHFICSGPKDPRTGGVIIAMAPTKDEIETLITKDPFHQQGLAEYTITQFNAVKHADWFKGV